MKELPLLNCLRCGHKWRPRSTRSPYPARCPHCLSKFWDKPRVGGEKDIDTMEQVDTPLCKLCKQLLEKVPWNSVTDIQYCVNVNCQAYHRPVPISRPEKIETIEDKARRLFREWEYDENKEGNKTPGRDKDLQRLREKILYQ